ncbi:hypothetical protein CEXT_88341 [Caerostris extrusa]|uniref:Uncharacterized protein n=1 Tax=Caerostris extrusa TaxID=172846 RepID=A0AAV4ME11_CAEEX|nr:hypothetical protein CEXT_88341 [Caerostris extrusa]
MVVDPLQIGRHPALVADRLLTVLTLSPWELPWPTQDFHWILSIFNESSSGSSQGHHHKHLIVDDQFAKVNLSPDCKAWWLVPSRLQDIPLWSLGVKVFLTLSPWELSVMSYGQNVGFCE